MPLTVINGTADISGRVIFVPRLNMPACVSGTRGSMMDGVNMKRAFLGDRKGTLTYRIANFVTTRIFPQIDVVLEIQPGARGSELALFQPFQAPLKRVIRCW